MAMNVSRQSTKSSSRKRYDRYMLNKSKIVLQNVKRRASFVNISEIIVTFHSQVCYLPICFFLLKPLHRLLRYQMLMELLLDNYSDDNPDKTDVQGALMMLSRTNELITEKIAESENFVLLCEIQRDLTGFDSLVSSERKLIRQGCLLKHSRRGLQQRMFFLFSDILIYASKPQFLQTFKVLGHFPVRSLLTENSEHNSFVIYGGGVSINVSAATTFEKNLWMEELQKAASNLKYSVPQLAPGFTGLKRCSEF